MLNLCCPLENQPWGTRSSPGVSGKDVTEVAQKEESAGLTWTLQPSQSPQPHGPSQVCCQETSRVAKKQGQTPPPGSVPARVPNGSALLPLQLSQQSSSSLLPSLLSSPKQSKELIWAIHAIWGSTRKSSIRLSDDNLPGRDNSAEAQEEKGLILKWCTRQFRDKGSLQHTLK